MTIPDLIGLLLFPLEDEAAREARTFQLLEYAASRARAARTVSRILDMLFFFDVFVIGMAASSMRWLHPAWSSLVEVALFQNGGRRVKTAANRSAVQTLA
jgi:hypothetical protein